MNGPTTSQLREVADFQSGGTPSKANSAYWNGTIPWLTPKDMTDYDGSTQDHVTEAAIGNGTRLAPAGALFIAVRGMSLHNEIRVVRPAPPMSFNQDIKAIIPKAIDGDFLYYALTNLKPRLLGLVESAGHGTGVLPTGQLADLTIHRLGETAELAVASVLRALDDKIALNRRMNTTLETIARSIFKDWFVDFGPTRAKIEGRVPYLAPDTWKLFPDSLDAGGRPWGWAASTIGEEVEVLGGSTPSTKEPAYWSGDIAWATPKDLSSLSTPVLLGTERHISTAGLSQISSGLLPAGTVLLSSRAPIGYMAIAQIPTAVNQGFIAMVCRRRLSNVFVWLWTEANIETVHQKANGSTFQEISKGSFRSIGVVVPSSQTLRAFDSAVIPSFNRIVANDLENLSLSRMRDFLLPKLMSGVVTVKVAEKIIGGAI